MTDRHRNSSDPDPARERAHPPGKRDTGERKEAAPMECGLRLRCMVPAGSAPEKDDDV